MNAESLSAYVYKTRIWGRRFHFLKNFSKSFCKKSHKKKSTIYKDSGLKKTCKIYQFINFEICTQYVQKRECVLMRKAYWRFINNRMQKEKRFQLEGEVHHEG